MQFQAIKTAIIALLNANAATGRFSVMSYQQQTHDADEIAEYNRHVTVYYKGGTFNPQGSRPKSGVVLHDMTFQIDMLVAGNAVVDLATLDNPASTDHQRSVALAAYYEGGAHADDLMDDLWAQLYNIFENPVNFELGFASGIISDIPGIIRLDDFQKANVTRQGQQVILGASALYKIRCVESTAGTSTLQVLNTIQNKIEPTPDIVNGVLDPNVISDPPEVDVKNLQTSPS